MGVNRFLGEDVEPSPRDRTIAQRLVSCPAINGCLQRDHESDAKTGFFDLFAAKPRFATEPP